MSASIRPSSAFRLLRARRSLHTSTAKPNAPTASTPPKPARLRFAPSPTGYLHLGGLRTCLFNHLLARSLGGKWILRIEDTDQTRLVPSSVSALQRTLEWAKLDYDEGPSAGGKYGPYVQSERLDLYRSYAERLVESGAAYKDFRPAVQVEDARVKQQPLREEYIPPTEAEAKHLISLGKKYVVRLRAPNTALEHEDLVYGSMHFPSDPTRAGTEDPILLKSNGWPTYHLANVVDDHEMGITHVLRGEEWIPSLPKHLWLYEALGLTSPKFAHLPLLVNADGTKLSKRTGDVRVESYIERGFEPEALNNWVGLLGYNNSAYHNKEKGEKEVDEAGYDVLTMQEMISGFGIANVNRSRATVDMSKLYYLNARHIGLKLEDQTPGGGREELVAKIQPRLVEAFPEMSQRLTRQPGLIVDVLLLTKGTSATLYDVPESATPLFRHPDFSLPEAQSLFAKNALINTHFAAAVREATHLFSALMDSDWNEESVHEVITRLPKVLSDATLPAKDVGKEAAKKPKIKKAALLAPLRFAISARERGAPLADLFLFLGRDETLERLRIALDAYESGKLTSDTQ